MKILDHDFISTKRNSVYFCKKCNCACVFLTEKNCWYFVSDVDCDGLYFDIPENFIKCEKILNNRLIKEIII